jgi:hypothetical protein
LFNLYHQIDDAWTCACQDRFLDDLKSIKTRRKGAK